MDHARPNGRRGVPVLEAPPAHSLFRGGKAPVGMEQLRERGASGTFRRETAHESPDLNRDACLGLFVDETAGREHGIVKMRRKIYPSHGTDLTIEARDG
jgi:hypothetical protein